jgi:8-oxo-dGTP pyrophosphatase MutT (NUDIX family)
MNLSLTRIQVMLANKKISFLISIVLATLTLHITSPDGLFGLKQSNNKRKGVGGRDATGELHSVLRRKEEGRAAVAIIRVIDDETDPDVPVVKYLVQMKSHDYPIPAFRGSICLLGGNANTNDATPIDTLVRELKEELGSTGSLSWINKINADKVIDESALLQIPYNKNATNTAGRIRFLGLSMHSQSAKVVQKKHPYSFLCALYEITLYPFQLPPTILYPRGATVQEGRLALLTEDQLIHHAKYSWGYEYTMSRYFGKNVSNVVDGVGVEDVASESVGEWTPEKR